MVYKFNPFTKKLDQVRSTSDYTNIITDGSTQDNNSLAWVLSEGRWRLISKDENGVEVNLLDL